MPMDPQPIAGLGAKALELSQSSVVKITKEAFKDAPPAVKAALYAPAISGVVFGLGLLSSLFYLDAGQKWLALLFGGLLLIGLYIPHWKPLRLDGSMLQLSGINPALPMVPAIPNAPIVGCRHIPIFPPSPADRESIKAALEEIRKNAADQIRAKVSGISDQDIRANMFLLAQMQGGPTGGKWRLVVHDDFAINMNNMPERQLQLSVGQGATGVAFRDGIFQLTRRSSNPKGQWDRKFLMTPELEAQVHKKLKWIVSFPLVKPNTNEAIGVLNIDGLADVADDDFLNFIASSVRDKVQAVAHHLSVQPSVCVGIDQIGAIDHV